MIKCIIQTQHYKILRTCSKSYFSLHHPSNVTFLLLLLSFSLVQVQQALKVKAWPAKSIFSQLGVNGVVSLGSYIGENLITTSIEKKKKKEPKALVSESNGRWFG